MDEAQSPEQRSIQSIEVGFRLIRALEEAGSKLPLKTLSARAEMPPGKAHLYLVSFMKIGLVVQDPVTSQYGLGPYALQLGLSALRQVNLTEVAHQPLEALHREFELPTYLSVWGRMGPFILLKHDADLPTPFSIKVGFVFPLLTTATGSVFLTHMPDAATRSLLQAESLLNPDLAAHVDEIRAGVRATGYAASKGHLFRGFSAISAPVFGHDGSLACAVSILGVAQVMDAGERSRLVGSVQTAARTISHALGAAIQI